MQRSMTRFAGVLAAAVFLCSCGGSDGPTNPGGGNGGGTGMSARVDGASWAADAISLAAIPGQAGLYTLTGAKSVNGGSKSLTLTLWNVSGPGTYAVGVTPEVIGATGSYGEAGAVWSTPFTGEAGVVTITVLTTTRIAGTFEFVAKPGTSNTATTSRTVTEGKFDLELSFAPPAFPANAGKKVSCTLNGAPWNAGTIGSFASGGQFTLSGTNGTYSVSVTLNDVTAPGTYALQPAIPFRTVTVTPGSGGTSSPNCCWGLQPTDTGSITVTSISADRVVGTFSVVLHVQPGSPGSGTITLANGTFDIGSRL